MGNFLNHNSADVDDIAGVSRNEISVTKRKAKSEWETVEPYSDVSCSRKSKRRRLKSTSDYIYNALFLEGENSDIKIQALNCEWNLHKVYLRQAGYFSGMFNSTWKESSMKVRLFYLQAFFILTLHYDLIKNVQI